LQLNKKPTTALTGATGFLGSHLMASLLREGYRVIVLGRSNKDESLNARILRLLDWFGIKNLAAQLTLVETDLSKPLMGLEETAYKKICSDTEEIVHCASDTSFSERKRDAVFRSNIASLDSILEFAANSKAGFFHYISTAYVAGKKTVVCKELLTSSDSFLNVYEESKAMAENIIAAYCIKKSIPYTIIRPSIVYGDSKTGRSLKFNALYFPVQSVKYIREIYVNDIKNNGGIKSSQYGIYLDNENNLYLPLRIYLPEKGILNIIPIDYFVAATMLIIARPYQGGIFHLTNNSHSSLDIIAGYNEKLMKIKGVEIIYGSLKNTVLRNPAEELFDRFIEPYRSYLSDNRVFERTNTDMITRDLYPPEFTYEIFKNCMEYAMRVNWGQSIF
jgi:nucleoside-diphosphate-sugar epimerase